MPSVLIVDDEANILSSLSRALRLENYDVALASSGKEARAAFSKRDFDVALLDVRLPDEDGLNLLASLKQDSPDIAVIMMSGHGTIETALEATRLGAHTFLEKPVLQDALLLALRNALAMKSLQKENSDLRSRVGGTRLLGDSAAMVALRELIALAASSQANVLVLGERGTGKELVARQIHESSKRANAAYEKLNCAAVPSELIESELFGHEAGAFTGAHKRRPGRFERAHKGTLFLDEIADTPLAMQAKLLRVLQEGELERVGGSETLRVDVRVVAATNKDLNAEIRAGRFRADLYDRLNVVPVAVPPLRDRRPDIALLANRFVETACRHHERRAKELTPRALAVLSDYNFPGNVRELQNLVERLVILVPADRIDAPDVLSHLPQAEPSERPASPFRTGVGLASLLDEVERTILQAALGHHGGHRTQAAADLGLERSHFHKKLKRHGIE